MGDTQQPEIEFARGICYSGYREGQSPGDGTYPSYEEILEDLRILAPNWQYLRLYDSSPHAEIVLDVDTRNGTNVDATLEGGEAIPTCQPSFGASICVKATSPPRSRM